MAWHNTSPQKREVESGIDVFDYRDGHRVYLPIPQDTNGRSFMSVIARRQSRRELQRPSMDDISALLWHTAKTRRTWQEPAGAVWQHRPVPSAGGRHPIDLLLVGTVTEHRMIARYDSLAHAIIEITMPQPSALAALIAEVRTILPSASDALVILFAAQIGKTLSKYKDGESLIWRDAGALDATLNLVAEALGLGYCALGITGEPWLSQALKSDSLVYGVGGGAFGRLT